VEAVGAAVLPEPAFYLPYRQTPQEKMSLLLRTSVEATSLLPAVTRLIQVGEEIRDGRVVSIYRLTADFRGVDEDLVR
jgi:hypothetical protein